MPVRRLNRPFIVVLTGVENAGKTTLAEGMSDRLGWPLIEEAARRDAAVLSGNPCWEDLERLQEAFITRVRQHRDGDGPGGVICDTGGLVLDIWAREAFGRALPRTEEAMALMDLHLLVHTVEDWEPDPLRMLPRLEDRITLQDRYRERLGTSGRPFAEIPLTTSAERLYLATDLITRHHQAP